MSINLCVQTWVDGNISAEEELPWLSILIPSFEHPSGIRRLIKALIANNLSGIECIIRDDSLSDDVFRIVEEFARQQKSINLIYERSSQRNGAVANWNSLIAMARGEYILFMHHDETPIGIDFFLNLQNELRSNTCIDVLMLGCLIGDENGVFLRRHMPIFLQSLLLRFFSSSYLLRHNFIGSPSTFVVRRSACQLFDDLFKWLVDVEWMNRILKGNSLRWKLSRDLCVASFQRTEGSITSSLKGELKEIERRELALICKKNDLGSLAFLLCPHNVWEKALGILDTVLWTTLRVAVRLLTMLFSKRNPFRNYGSD